MPDPIYLHDRHMIQWDGGYWYNKSTLFNLIAAHRYPARYAEFTKTKPCLSFWLQGCSQDERNTIKNEVMPILAALK